MTGLIVALEGIDGVGKTTQANAIYDHLINEGVRAIVMRNPGNTNVARQLDDETNAFRRWMLFAIGTSEIAGWASDLRADGYVVILDRYTLSMLAYQGTDPELNVSDDAVAIIAAQSTAGLLPDVNILLTRGWPTDERLKQVENTYRQITALQRWPMFDTEHETPEQTTRRILAAIEEVRKGNNA